MCLGSDFVCLPDWSSPSLIRKQWDGLLLALLFGVEAPE